MRRSAFPVIFLLLSTGAMGCNLVQSPVSATQQMMGMFRANPSDWTDSSTEDDGEWDFVGDEGRAEYAREQDPDPWFGRFIISDKARSIERNLGIDY